MLVGDRGRAGKHVVITGGEAAFGLKRPLPSSMTPIRAMTLKIRALPSAQGSPVQLTNGSLAPGRR